MKTWITSDLHFGHANIKKFCCVTRARFSEDIHEMTEQMIKEWNDLIAPEDLTYILGDVAFMSGFEAAKIMKRLNGQKILVIGNHDRKALKDIRFFKSFKEVHEYLEITYNGTHIVLFHYPIAEFNRQHRGSVHLYGHLHGKVSGIEQYRVYDVGMDSTGKIAVIIEDAIARALSGQIKTHHPEATYV